jgi:hypothetical protein
MHVVTSQFEGFEVYGLLASLAVKRVVGTNQIVFK